MIKRIYLFIFLIGFATSFAQVGINTTTPNASLEIKSSNQAIPANTDGILIPKIDTFPGTNPTALQNGMMVFLTTTVGTNQPGFYYWNNATTAWIAIKGSEDADWYKVATTSAPTSINDDMFHSGNVGVGKTAPSSKLDVAESLSTKFTVAEFTHTAPSNSTNTYIIKNTASSGTNTGGLITGVFNQLEYFNGIQGSGVFNLLSGNSSDALYGFRNSFSNIGTGLRAGLLNSFSSGTGIRYGVSNSFAGGGNQCIGAYNNFTGTPTSWQVGTLNNFNDVSGQAKYGMYNIFTNDGTTNGLNYGVKNTFDGIGTLQKYGMHNEMTGNGNGGFYGVYNIIGNTGTGDHIGIRNYLSGIGNGFKYGVLNIIDSGAGGVHYGVYSSALKSNSYAGYFLGRVSVGTTDSDKYIFPNSRGTAGQIMQTDGAGTLTWQNASSVIGNSFWSTTGNASLPSGGFLGTTFDYPLTIKVNNIVSGLIESDMYNKNTFLGYDAGTSSTNIAYNTAIGFQALNSLAGDGMGAGSFNTAIGKGAMFSSTLGTWNTALGYNSLYSNQTGNDNVAIGNEALLNNVSGSHNVAIGSQAGASELGSNKLYIGSPTLIYGEFDNSLLRNHTQKFLINDPTINGIQMVIKNSDRYSHTTDANVDFGATSGNFLMATAETQSETAGIRGDGDNVTVWSPGDGNRLLRILDEDNWNDNNGNPYDNAAEKAYIDATGAYFTVSDMNKKERIAKIENASDKLNQINGYTYQYKLSTEEVKKGQKPVESAGVLAQELEKVLPQAVSKSESGEYHVNYAAITPLLIEALKEQDAKIKSLEERLKRIEEKQN